MLFFALSAAFIIFVVVSECREYLEKAVKKNDILNQQLKDSNASKLAALQQHQRLQADFKQLQIKHNADISEHKSSLEKAQKDIIILKKQLQDSTSINQGILQTSKRLMERYGELMTNKQTADDEIKILKEQLLEMNFELEEVKDERDEQKVKLDEQREQLEKQQQQLEEYQQQASDFEAQATTSNCEWKSAEKYSFEDDFEQSDSDKKSDSKDMSWTSAEEYPFSDDDDDEEYEERHAYLASPELEKDLQMANVAPFKGFDYEETAEDLQKIDNFFKR
mmetsp:Transcript_18754/g.33538  ORF Transcript_18754/g.33538 Transcript_18754/m.33538 type:complete len:279 (+) Transcript_18754:342-1178(+)